jgi:hypothetical protein
VLSCTHEKGRPGPNWKFFYDLRAKALVKRITYDPFSMERIFDSGGTAVLAGFGGCRTVAMEYDAGLDPPFRLLGERQAARWTTRLPLAKGTAGIGADQQCAMYLQPPPSKPVSFGPGGRFSLVPDGESHETDNRLIVVYRGPGSTSRFPLPESTYEEFSAARPARVSNGYRRDGTEMDERIGPWQIADGMLWFAKKFYDGEGMTGVGGFGYFDIEKRRYRLYSPAAIRDWSTTAMLVEPDTVWLGLVRNGEYGSTGGGVLRFDRHTQQVTHYELREIVHQFSRIEGRLLMATDFGAAVLDGTSLRRFFVDQTSDGRLLVVEALLAY